MKPVPSMTLALAAIVACNAPQVPANDESPGEAPAPCIDTNMEARSALVDRVQFERPNAANPASLTSPVLATLVAWNSASHSVQFKRGSTNTLDTLEVKSIRLVQELREIRRAVQEALPSYKVTQHGHVTRTFASSELTIVAGVVHFPGCVMPTHGSLLGFVGTLSIEAGRVTLDGDVSRYEHEAPSNPGSPADGSNASRPKSG